MKFYALSLVFLRKLQHDNYFKEQRSCMVACCNNIQCYNNIKTSRNQRSQHENSLFSINRHCFLYKLCRNRLRHKNSPWEHIELTTLTSYNLCETSFEGVRFSLFCRTLSRRVLYVD